MEDSDPYRGNQFRSSELEEAVIMSDFAMYHALGEQDQEHPGVRTQPAPPQFNPTVAAPPSGYQQNVSLSNQYSKYSPRENQYQGNAPAQHQSYGNQQTGSPSFPGEGVYQTDGSTYDNMGNLTTQMGDLAVGDDSAARTARSSKKKHRHAFHALDTPSGASVSYNAAPYGGQPSPAGYNVQEQPQQFSGSGQTYFQQGSPAPLQGPFNPASTPSAVDFAPRDGFAGGIPQGGSQQGRVDPEQSPSVPRSRDGPAEYYLDHVYPTLENHLPPPATIPFIAYDQGNSSPKFARLSLNNIPSTAEFLASTGLPLGLVLQPLAALQPGELAIPVLDFGESGPPRCRRCRAYINPFMTFKSGGNKFVCNMCNFPNDVPMEYFSPTNPQGVRVDRDQRPELTRGTVEYMVPKEYWAKDPVGLRFLFLIDVCQEAVNKGFLDAICEGILATLYMDDSSVRNQETLNGDGGNGEENNGPPRALPVQCRVGIVTFDKEVHFYNLKASIQRFSANII